MKNTITLLLTLSMVSLLCCPQQSNAQTITLGTGTSLNGITTSSPINIWFRKTVCQMVYTADELTAEGAVAGDITQMGFFVSNNPIYDLPDYTIQMKLTTDADASGDLEGGYTTVKTIASYAPAAGGWDMLLLDTPFAWDGTQNIVVRICWSRVAPTYDPSGQLRVYNATGGYKYRRNDAGGSACGLVPNNVLNTKPQIRFIFQSETEWTGAINTDWANAGNWTAGVPVETIDALIPAGVPNDPVLNAVGQCKNLNLNGSLTLGSLAELNVYGDFINSGTYTDLGGDTRFTGVVAHNLSTSSPMTVMNLEANTSAGTTLSGEVIIGGELLINKGLFNTGDNMIIRSDASGTARIAELSTTCTYTIAMTDTWGDGWNGGFITVFEDGVSIGTFTCIGPASSADFQITADSDFTINYTSGSYENENAYTITDESGTVIFSDGTTPGTGDVYSDVAAGCSFSSTISGDMTMQRYIDAGETFWRYFASAVEDPTISQYLDDFTTAGFPDSHFPDFPFTSIYSYDETLPPGLGYVPCSGIDEVIEVGQGYQVWSGDTITGTEPFLVDITGPVNQGDINMPVTYTPSGTPTEDGWCLVGNPYASTIDWDGVGWTKTNMANATYIQDPDTQNYATYIAGAGANGGSRYIASQQSFWVQATTTGPVLTIRETVKSSVDATFFRSREVYSPGMTLRVENEDASDEVVIRHIAGKSNEVEHDVDALKLYGGWAVIPQIAAINDEGEFLTVHSFDKGFEEWTIPMQVVVFETGLYQLVFENPEELEVPCLQLEDSYTGTYYDVDMADGSVFEFELYDTTFAPRFYLHLGRSYETIEVDASCYEGTNGEYEIDLDIEDELMYELLSVDTIIEGAGTANPLVIDGLSQGLYALTIEGVEDLCGASLFHFSIDEPTPIGVEAEVGNEIFGSDGSITTEVTGGTMPYSYAWSNGATTPNIYGLSNDFYEVYVTDAKGCMTSDGFYVDSFLENEEEELVETGVKIWYNELENRVYFEGLQNGTNEIFYLIDVQGRVLDVYESNDISENQSFPIGLPLSKGVYFIQSLDRQFVLKFAK